MSFQTHLITSKIVSVFHKKCSKHQHAHHGNHAENPCHHLAVVVESRLALATYIQTGFLVFVCVLFLALVRSFRSFDPPMLRTEVASTASLQAAQDFKVTGC